MAISKEIVIYANLPYKKYRWISYYAFTQLVFLTVNLVVLPIPRLIEERNEARKKAAKVPSKQNSNKSMSEFSEDDIPTPEAAPTILGKLRQMNYSELFHPKNVVENITERPYLSIGVITVSAMIKTAFMFYARRSIHMITLLPQERVHISFFSPFAVGKPPAVELPLQHVSCVTSRSAQKDFSILKLKGYLGYHVVHGDGKFLEPKLYDEYLGYSRSWAK